MTNPRKKEFAHDFFGSQDPKMSPQLHGYGACKTFSVGIFRWLLKVSGKGLKKSAVMYRVKGYTSNPEPVYKRAKEICEEFDEEFPHIPLWLGYRKSETVKQKRRTK